MDYQKIHDLIIENTKKRKLTGYVEKHHITPRCMGGSDDSDNIVSLTAREHFIIHKLLTKIYPNNQKLNYAVWIMTTTRKGYYKIGAREYEKIRNSIVVSDETKQKQRNASLGRKHSVETLKKISEAAKKRLSDPENHPMYGKVHNDGTLRKMREYIKTEDWKSRVSKSLKLHKRTEDHCKNISKSKKGFPNWAKGVKNRWTELQLLKNRNNQPTVMRVNQYSKTGEFIKTWDSITETKKICSGVWHCLNGIQKTSGGYIWKYADTQNHN